MSNGSLLDVSRQAKEGEPFIFIPAISWPKSKLVFKMKKSILQNVMFFKRRRIKDWEDFYKLLAWPIGLPIRVAKWNMYAKKILRTEFTFQEESQSVSLIYSPWRASWNRISRKISNLFKTSLGSLPWHTWNENAWYQNYHLMFLL